MTGRFDRTISLQGLVARRARDDGCRSKDVGSNPTSCTSFFLSLLLLLLEAGGISFLDAGGTRSLEFAAETLYDEIIMELFQQCHNAILWDQRVDVVKKSPIFISIPVAVKTVFLCLILRTPQQTLCTLGAVDTMQHCDHPVTILHFNVIVPTLPFQHNVPLTLHSPRCHCSLWVCRRP